MEKIHIKLGETPHVGISLGGVTVTPVIGDADPYDGDYDVLPLPETQILPTAKKYCENNITVKRIPFYEVSNSGGGTTVVIDKIEP